MFYSAQLVSRDGPLQVLWVAATLDRQLSRQLVDGTAIPRMVDRYLDPEAEEGVFAAGWGGKTAATPAARGKGDGEDAGGAAGGAASDNNSAPLALRLSGQLLLGVCRIYSRKVSYLLQDCERVLLLLRSAHPEEQALQVYDNGEGQPRLKHPYNQHDGGAGAGCVRPRQDDDGDLVDDNGRSRTALRGRRRTGVPPAAGASGDGAAGNGSITIGPDGQPLLQLPYDEEDEILLAGTQGPGSNPATPGAGGGRGGAGEGEGGEGMGTMATPHGGASGPLLLPSCLLDPLAAITTTSTMSTTTGSKKGLRLRSAPSPWAGGSGGYGGSGCLRGSEGVRTSLSDPHLPTEGGSAQYECFDDQELPDHFEFDLDEHEIEALRGATQDPPMAGAAEATAGDSFTTPQRNPRTGSLGVTDPPYNHPNELGPDQLGPEDTQEGQEDDTQLTQTHGLVPDDDMTADTGEAAAAATVGGRNDGGTAPDDAYGTHGGGDGGVGGGVVLVCGLAAAGRSPVRGGGGAEVEGDNGHRGRMVDAGDGGEGDDCAMVAPEPEHEVGLAPLKGVASGSVIRVADGVEPVAAVAAEAVIGAEAAAVAGGGEEEGGSGAAVAAGAVEPPESPDVLAAGVPPFEPSQLLSPPSQPSTTTITTTHGTPRATPTASMHPPSPSHMGTGDTAANSTEHWSTPATGNTITADYTSAGSTPAAGNISTSIIAASVDDLAPATSPTPTPTPTPHQTSTLTATTAPSNNGDGGSGGGATTPASVAANDRATFTPVLSQEQQVVGRRRTRASASATPDGTRGGCSAGWCEGEAPGKAAGTPRVCMAGSGGGGAGGRGAGARITLDVDHGRTKTTLPTNKVRELLQDRTPLIDVSRRSACYQRRYSASFTAPAVLFSSPLSPAPPTGPATTTTAVLGSPWLASWSTCGGWSPKSPHRSPPLKFPRLANEAKTAGYGGASATQVTLLSSRHQVHRPRYGASSGSGAVTNIGIGPDLGEQALDIASGPASVPASALGEPLRQMFGFLSGSTAEDNRYRLTGTAVTLEEAGRAGKNGSGSEGGKWTTAVTVSERRSSRRRAGDCTTSTATVSGISNGNSADNGVSGGTRGDQHQASGKGGVTPAKSHGSIQSSDCTKMDTTTRLPVGQMASMALDDGATTTATTVAATPMSNGFFQAPTGDVAVDDVAMSQQESAAAGRALEKDNGPQDHLTGSLGHIPNSDGNNAAGDPERQQDAADVERFSAHELAPMDVSYNEEGMVPDVDPQVDAPGDGDPHAHRAAGEVHTASGGASGGKERAAGGLGYLSVLEEEEAPGLWHGDAGEEEGKGNKQEAVADEEEVAEEDEVKGASLRHPASDGFTPRTKAVLQKLQTIMRTARKARQGTCGGPAKRPRLDATVAHDGTPEVHGEDGVQVTTATELLMMMMTEAEDAALTDAAARRASPHSVDKDSHITTRNSPTSGTASPATSPWVNGAVGGAVSCAVNGGGGGTSIRVTRIAAARTFYDLLVLSNRGYISLAVKPSPCSPASQVEAHNELASTATATAAAATDHGAGCSTDGAVLGGELQGHDGCDGRRALCSPGRSDMDGGCLVVIARRTLEGALGGA